MEDIFLREPLEIEKIQKVLEDLFPGLTIFHYDFNDEKPSTLDLENPKHIFFHLIKHYSQATFDFEIRVYRTNSISERDRALYIAQKLSDTYSISTMVEHVPISAGQPLHSVIFEDGKIFIALPEYPGGGARSVNLDEGKKEYSLVLTKFDSDGNYILS